LARRRREFDMLGERVNRTYLSVGYGRIRKKCERGTPGSVERTTAKGEITCAIEYSFLSGTLEGIQYRQSDEYGNSWAVDVADGDQHYRLQIPEQSRECGDLLKRLPNLLQYQFYKFTPYEFKEKNKKGLSIKDKMDQPVPSFYQKYDQTGDTWKVTNIQGFPDVDFDTKIAETDDWKIYFLRVNRFLREKALAILSGWGSKKEDVPVHEAEVSDGIPSPTDNDIPF
jgi:hypothetical protein